MEPLDALRPRLVRFCAGYVGADLAEDAAQEVLVRALSSPERPERRLPWLLRVARNYCLNELRARRARPPATSARDSALAARVTGQITRLLRAEERAALEAALAELSDDRRELLRLRYAEELTRAEIAELLELPEPLVKSRLFEAVERLRARLGPSR